MTGLYLQKSGLLCRSRTCDLRLRRAGLSALNNIQQCLTVGRFEVPVETGVVVALGGVLNQVLGVGRFLSGKPTNLSA